MRLQPYTPCAIGLGIALALSVPAAATAQIDTTRRDTSDVRIQMRKGDAGMRNDQGVVRREAGGDVMTPNMARLDSLEATAEMYRMRIDSLEAANRASGERVTLVETNITVLRDSLAATRTEIEALRAEMATLSSRVDEMDTRVQHLNQRFDDFRNRTVFGNSGFYVGVGSGANLTYGTLDDLGYGNAFNVTVPIGWHKPGSMLGIRTEWGFQQLEGRGSAPLSNPDADVFSGVAMLTVNFPLNARNNFYLMGGGGFYQFRNFGSQSALGQKFATSLDDTDSETKWGFNAGAGLEIHLLGAASLFAQTSWTNVAVDEGTVAGVEGRNLRWVPLLAGFMIR
jgi:opacity protein-like surface antigen